MSPISIEIFPTNIKLPENLQSSTTHSLALRHTPPKGGEWQRRNDGGIVTSLIPLWETISKENVHKNSCSSLLGLALKTQTSPVFVVD